MTRNLDLFEVVYHVCLRGKKLRTSFGSERIWPAIQA